MTNLSVFDEEYNLIRELDDDQHYDVALEVSRKLKGSTDPISKDAEEMLWVEKSKYRRTFIQTMLFADANTDLIAKCMGMEEKHVIMYGKLFFDMALVRGELGKTEIYETIFEHHPEGSEIFSYGVMLRDAHLGGPEIIMAQFNIKQSHYSVQEYRDRQQALLMWRLESTERGSKDYDALLKEIRARDATISAIQKAGVSDEKAKTSDLGSLVKILDQLRDSEIGVTDVDLEYFDMSNENVKAIESKEIKEK